MSAPVDPAAVTQASPSSDGLATGVAREAARAKLFGRAAVPPKVGRHVVIEPIGSGAMGVVYAAYDPELDRKIAVKVVRSGAEPGLSRARLLREAQALARLSHPNVVHVYDVGTQGGDVYVAMEFLQGHTLTRWMQSRQPGWAPVVRVFAEAAHGLVAAHAAGLVHRDFKPDNVIITDDGRVVVVDFGLARPDASAPSSAPEGGRRDGDSTSDAMESEDVDRSLTRRGAVIGTPAYMSPEQFRGEPADAKSDQFAFCAALFEALHGVRPFAGEGVHALAETVQRGAIRAVPESGVPRWLDALVRRGLSSDPADRFDGMAEVAAALAKRRRSIAGRVIPAVLLLATGGVTTWALAAGDDPVPPCPFDASEWEGVWDAATRERVEGAMARVQIPSAEHAWLRISAELDAQTAEVSRMRVEACEATRVRGVQSDDLLDRRMVCLDRVRDQIAASIDVLQEADREVVLHVDELLGEIPPLQRCADAEYLGARVAPPPDPDAAAEAKAIRQLVGEAASQRAVTRLDAALRTAEEARRRAVDLDYAPVLAEATYALGDVHESRAAYEEAERLYHEAYWIASDVGHDEAVLRIASDLGFVIADAMGKPEEGLVWLRHAESAARRAGLDEWLDRLRAHRAAFQVMGGDAEAAIPILEEVAASMAADDPRRAAVYGNLGAAFAQLGRWDRAFDAQQKALAIAERTYGVDHPEYAKVLANLATAEATSEGFAEAERMLRRSVAIYEHTYREPHPFMAQALCSLGALASDQGRYGEAIDAFERCNEIVVETLGENHPGRASALVNIGNALAETGRFAEAADRYEEAIAVDQQTLPPEHPDRAFALVGVGTSLTRLGRAAEAIEPLERAVAVRDADAIEPSIRATAELALARALWRSGRDRPRARALAEAARRHSADAGKPVPAVPIDEWLAQD